MIILIFDNMVGHIACPKQGHDSGDNIAIFEHI